MALINCSECGKQISDKASSCPSCGNPMAKSSITYPTNRPISTVSTNSEENLLHCPRCKSTQLSSNKKGFSGSKALAGAVLTGGIGLLAGTIGSGDVVITCLNCGHKYKAGELNIKVKKIIPEREAYRKPVIDVGSYGIVIFVCLIFGIIGFIISYKLFSNEWTFLGIIFSIPTIFCFIMTIDGIIRENKRINRNQTSSTIPQSTTSIKNGAFYDYKSLSSIIIPNSVTSIGHSAFEGCRKLTSITIGNSVSSIGNRAFSGCDSLTSITIPNSVTSIGDFAFEGCTRLTSIYVYATTPIVLSSNVFAFNTCILYVPTGSENAYKSAPVWEDFYNIVEIEPKVLTTQA